MNGGRKADARVARIVHGVVLAQKDVAENRERRDEQRRLDAELALKDALHHIVLCVALNLAISQFLAQFAKNTANVRTKGHNYDINAPIR